MTSTIGKLLGVHCDTEFDFEFRCRHMAKEVLNIAIVYVQLSVLNSEFRVLYDGILLLKSLSEIRTCPIALETNSKLMVDLHTSKTKAPGLQFSILL